MTKNEDLGEDARQAYQAFLDMSDSKSRHFACLQAIESRYQSGGAPSLAENLELEKLLSVHDKNVLAFRTAMAAVSEEADKQRLLELMA